MILFIDASVRQDSRTRRLANALLSALDGEVEQVRLENVRFETVNESFLNKRDALIAEKSFHDGMFVLARQFAEADLIVIAIGKEGFLDGRFAYKESATIVDVGINRGEDGKLHGDALPGLPVKLQTPVPGGVGLLTRLALMENLVKAYKNR